MQTMERMTTTTTILLHLRRQPIQFSATPMIVNRTHLNFVKSQLVETLSLTHWMKTSVLRDLIWEENENSNGWLWNMRQRHRLPKAHRIRCFQSISLPKNVSLNRVRSFDRICFSASESDRIANVSASTNLFGIRTAFHVNVMDSPIKKSVHI